ncbi:MAG: metallophosphoesterase family protein [Deltaproteobacteria bacterium]|nr:metallophosphoesterase family protein [Deltaproteobacteria bacterium]
MVGLLSDTHGLLRPEALAALKGAAHLVHAGDVGTPELLAALRALAPVTAVRGNTDAAPWARDLPTETLVEVRGVWIAVVHDLSTLRLDPRAAGASAVVFGHSHRPLVEDRGGILYVNPGAAGPRRFGFPVSVGRLRIAGGRAVGEIAPLAV